MLKVCNKGPLQDTTDRRINRAQQTIVSETKPYYIAIMWLKQICLNVCLVIGMVVGGGELSAQTYTHPNGMSILIDPDERSSCVEVRLIIDKGNWPDESLNGLMVEHYARQWHQQMTSITPFNQSNAHPLRFIPDSPLNPIDYTSVSVRFDRDNFESHLAKIMNSIIDFEFSTKDTRELSIYLDRFKYDSLFWKERGNYSSIYTLLKTPREGLKESNLTKKDVRKLTTVFLCGAVDKINVLKHLNDVTKNRIMPIRQIRKPQTESLNTIRWQDDNRLLISLAVPPATYEGIVVRHYISYVVKRWLDQYNWSGTYRKYIPWNRQWDYMHIYIEKSTRKVPESSNQWYKLMNSLQNTSISALKHWYYNQWPEQLRRIKLDEAQYNLWRNLSYYYFNQSDFMFLIYVPQKFDGPLFKKDLQAIVGHELRIHE
ncbi:MAG: hypothetical protein GF313_07635 [Caldithrix sp.]|nr:hypothetical protein [Caldithrix sp.]